MLLKYKYEGREYKGSELPALARKTFGDKIYEELVRQIKTEVAEKKREIDYINLTDVERKVYELKGSKKEDGTYLTTRELGRMFGLTPTGVTSAYNSAVKKITRNVPGHISILNVHPRTLNALIVKMGGNVIIEELVKAMNKSPNSFIKCNGLGYTGYNDTITELERLGFDMDKMPRFDTKGRFSLYREKL